MMSLVLAVLVAPSGFTAGASLPRAAANARNSHGLAFDMSLFDTMSSVAAPAKMQVDGFAICLLGARIYKPNAKAQLQEEEETAHWSTYFPKVPVVQNIIHMNEVSAAGHPIDEETVRETMEALDTNDDRVLTRNELESAPNKLEWWETSPQC